MVRIACLFFVFELTFALIVLVTWMMLTVTVGNSGYDMKF